MFQDKSAPVINLLGPDPEKQMRRRTIIQAVVFALILAVIGGLGAQASYRAGSQGTSVIQELGNLPVISDIRRLVSGPTTNTDATAQDRLNILVLGIGGEGHDGPQLTDTILLVSADLKNKKIGIVSLPRDLAYPLGGGQFEKMNAVNAYAEQQYPGEGAKRTADALAKLFDIRIDHVLRVDFRGFAALVNAVDGLDINVERSFTDEQYPAPDDKFTTVSFKKGFQHMYGETALVFVRSRHGNNGEGSDFARSRRQQLVTLALRDKLLSLGTLADPRKLAALYSALANHVQTDLTPWDILRLAPLAGNFSRDQVVTRVLTDAPDGELVAANVDGAFMLFPKKPDWSEIRDIVKDPFTDKNQRLAQDQPAEHIKLEIRNGTTRTGFAAQFAGKLEKEGYEITAFGNAPRRGYDQSVLFDLTGGKKTVELTKLRHALNASLSLNSVTSTAGADFLLILGESAYPLLAN